MAVLDKNIPSPTEIKLHQKSRILEISFADGKTFQFPCEFLRVYSPSAEVRGHGPGQEVLQVGKKNVEIKQIEPVQRNIQHRHFCVTFYPMGRRVHLLVSFFG